MKRSKTRGCAREQKIKDEFKRRVKIKNVEQQSLGRIGGLSRQRENSSGHVRASNVAISVNSAAMRSYNKVRLLEEFIHKLVKC